MLTTAKAGVYGGTGLIAYTSSMNRLRAESKYIVDESSILKSTAQELRKDARSLRLRAEAIFARSHELRARLGTDPDAIR